GTANLDAVDGERGSFLLRACVEQSASGRLGGFDIRLVEGVDAQDAACDGGGVFPDQQLGSESPADLDLALDHLVGLARTLYQPDHLEVWQVQAEFGGVNGEHDRQQAGAVLTGRFGDQLFCPVGESDDVCSVGDNAELVL